MKEQRLAYLRPEQLDEALKQAAIAYLPIGLLEWHGPHLPFGVDAFNAEHVALQSAQQTGGVVLPTLYVGTERERPAEMLDWLGLDPESYVVGMDFPKNSHPSMYFAEEVFALVVREQLFLAWRMGFQFIVIVSGHAAGNHLQVLERLAIEHSHTRTGRAIVVLPFVRNMRGIMEVGHASRIETSVMLALHPETVRLDALPPQPEPLPFGDYAIVDFDTFLGRPTNDKTVPAHDDPRAADAAAGQSTIAAAVTEIVTTVRRAYEQLKNT